LRDLLIEQFRAKPSSRSLVSTKNLLQHFDQQQCDWQDTQT